MNDLELEAACSLTEMQAREILSLDKKEDIVFKFNQFRLLDYLRDRPELCDKILNFSYDKRCTPSTFVEEFEDVYRVGWFDKDREQVKYFDKLYEAITDYVLFTWNLVRLHRDENRLPKHIRDKAIESGNEFGWKQTDFMDVVEAARQIPMAIVGGQVQYALPDGTCELYWLSYDPTDRQVGEEWTVFCNRSADECISKFKRLITTIDIEKDALESFPFLQDKKNSGINIEEFQIFILYFDDEELK